MPGITFVIPNVFAGLAGPNVNVSLVDDNFIAVRNALSGLVAAVADLPNARGHLAGLTTSYSAVTTLGVAAGSARDSTNVADLTLAAAFTGTLGGTWVVGSGNAKLDAGAVAASTWYHAFVIGKAAGADPDILFSLSATAPTLPTSYALFRRIGSFLTTGASQITNFVQAGDYFRWLAYVADLIAANPGTAAVTRTMTVPTGVNVFWLGTVYQTDSAVANDTYLSDLAATDEVANNGTAQLSSGLANQSVAGQVEIRTNTSAQIRSRMSASGTSTIRLGTYGWIDRRGQDA